MLEASLLVAAIATVASLNGFEVVLADDDLMPKPAIASSTEDSQPISDKVNGGSSSGSDDVTVDSPLSSESGTDDSQSSSDPGPVEETPVLAYE
jgi:hypothetical protein